MRFLHTADWHLGRILHGQHLVDDQAHVLRQIVAQVREQRPDAVLLAGDVYDRSVPPTDAIELLDEVLTTIALELKTPVIGIAGNHDSAGRLGFGSRLFAAQGLHINGRLRESLEPVRLEDAAGPVLVYAIPYCEPVEVRHLLDCAPLANHDEAMRALLAHLRAKVPAGVRTVLVAHAFVAGGTASESERPLSVGGQDQVFADAFAGFDYVALGHLHRPQRIGKDDRLHYSGSPLKYSFSEATDLKSSTLVELGPDGGVALEFLPLTPLRDLRIIRGLFRELMSGDPKYGDREDYLKVVLDDEGTLYEAMPRLRELYPNALHLERTILTVAAQGGARSGDLRRMSPLQLFTDFYEQATEAKPTAEQLACMTTVIDALIRDDREGGDAPT